MPTIPSKRFRAAARAERAALLRTHSRLSAEHQRRSSLLADTAGQLADVEHRLNTLAVLVGDPTFAHVPPAEQHPEPAPPANPNPRLISGAEVRRTAVQVLLSRPDRFKPLHYLDWYKLVTDAGYAIKAKTPPAAFLTQLRTSPLVAKADEPGVYSLDAGAAARLRERLEVLQGELREVTLLPVDQFRNLASSEIRRELIKEINRIEAQLAEIAELLPSEPRPALGLVA